MDNYGQIIRDLFSRHQSVGNCGFTPDSYKPGLERMLQFADIISGGEPQPGHYIHVAGTNGKGSVSHQLAAALAVTHSRVGLYTSPHLLDFRERIRIVSDGGVEMISKEAVMEFIGLYGGEADRLALSFFEITTGMALWYFRRAATGVAVLETGLGGCLDSTNIVTPDLSIITSIGLDHCALLGGTRPEIALEKAGIIKPGIPALIGEKDFETEPVFRLKASQTGSPLYFAEDFDFPPVRDPDLGGRYQAANFRTTLAALSLLGLRSGVAEYAALSRTAQITDFHGRWERLRLGASQAILDIGHNPAALRGNFACLREEARAGGRRLLIIYGVMADKDLPGIIPLMPRDASYIFTTPSTPRALPSSMILSAFRRKSEAPACDTASVDSALRLAASRADAGTLIYIGGSAYVVADALSSGLLVR